jgi:leader peptidase (prepilin peptidase)/N-methyltransferase
MPVWKLYLHVPTSVFVFAFGAIVGSFINVVIYRLPAGMSVISPPSRCPFCGVRLAWYENLPILGWFIIRGRCRTCKAPISPQYMLIEAFMACLFLALYAAFYMAGPASNWWWSQVGGDWWYYSWVVRTLPAFLALVFMLAGLTAMTMIDARAFIIPIGIPRVLTVIAFVAWPVQALLPSVPRAWNTWAIPTTDWHWFAIAACGMAGVLLAWGLLRRGIIPYSFADYDKYVPEGQVIGDYPHARREMGVEMLFLLPVIAALTAGHFIGTILPATIPPLVVQALGGSLLGYLCGAGIVWAVRILGTLGFGREAMGLGDVHLLGAIGAVLGWIDPLWIFLLAPFSGLSWVVVSMGTSSLLKRERRELPYGPHLAIATLAVIFCRPALEWVQYTYLSGIQTPGLVP